MTGKGYRVRRKVDENHPAILKELRQAGCSVQSLATVGHGCPDLLVWSAGELHLLEVKSGSKQLTQSERDWHAAWGGTVHIVRSVAEALAAVGVTRS